MSWNATFPGVENRWSGTSTEVQVAAAAEVLNTTNSTLGGLVTEDQVSILPLNGRDITGLVFLQPGVAQEINSLWFGLSYWAGNGNRGQTNSSYLDGIDSSDSWMALRSLRYCRTTIRPSTGAEAERLFRS